MSKFWTRFWWGFTFLGMAAMLFFWFIPEPIGENDPMPDERAAVVENVKRIQSDLSYARVDSVKAHRKRVVEVNITWTGPNAPEIKDRAAWGREADRVAQRIAQQYLPEGWQVNVAIWYRRLPRGIAGRTAGAKQGGPAQLFR